MAIDIPVNEVWVAADQAITLDYLKSKITAAHITDATVTCSVNKVGPNGALGATIVSDISMPYIAGTPSLYRGFIPHDAAIVPGVEYYLTVLAVTPAPDNLQIPFRQRRTGAYANGRAA